MFGERRVDERLGVLFLCTGNSARSLLAEAILTERGGSRFRSYSAGSVPTGAPHPLTIETLTRLGHDPRALRSKSWDEFARAGAPPIDFVITVCDAASREACPIWVGRPTTAHWGVADPAAFTGPIGPAREVFVETYHRLGAKVDRLLAIDFEALDVGQRARRVRAIGRADEP